jgi:lysophospholipase
LIYVLSRQLRSVRTRADDVANWPNVSFRLLEERIELIESQPFNGLKKDTFEDSDSPWLERK